MRIQGFAPCAKLIPASAGMTDGVFIFVIPLLALPLTSGRNRLAPMLLMFHHKMPPKRLPQKPIPLLISRPRVSAPCGVENGFAPRMRKPLRPVMSMQRRILNLRAIANRNLPASARILPIVSPLPQIVLSQVVRLMPPPVVLPILINAMR